LGGYAGTGKSFLICHLMKWLADRKFAFVAAAPTNKAAKKRMARNSNGILFCF
jgi:hypothetical protein